MGKRSQCSGWKWHVLLRPPARSESLVEPCKCAGGKPGKLPVPLSAKPLFRLAWPWGPRAIKKPEPN